MMGQGWSAERRQSAGGIRQIRNTKKGRERRES